MGSKLLLQDHTLISGAVSASGGSANQVRVWDAEKVDALLAVSAVSGTNPTLQIKFQSTDIKDLNDVAESDWYDIQDMPTFTVTGNWMTTIEEGLGRHLRAYITLGGTEPVFTLTLKIIKHLKL